MFAAMTPEEITAHLDRFHEREERLASAERERIEKEQAIFRQNQADCLAVLKEKVEPLLERLSRLLAVRGHPSVVLVTQESGHVTERTKLKSVEYAAAIEVERAKGKLIMRVVASPQTRRISSLVGVPHANCSSTFHCGDGPLSEAEDVTNRGIADFMISAFPVR